jgi:hypothetical protein
VSVKTVFLAAAATALIAVPAGAHHSFSMFDQGKTFTVQGTVKEVLLVNPHSWLQLMVTDAQGKAVEYTFEMSAVATMVRDGWTRDKVHVGDKVTVVGHPLRDGTPGGQFLSITLPSGEKIAHVYRDTPPPEPPGLNPPR